MKYLQKKFSVSLTGNKEYEKNYDRIFKKSLRKKVRIFIDNLLFKLFWKNGKH